MAQAFDPASWGVVLDIAIKAMALLLLTGAGVAVIELIRYLRALRRDRELNHRLVLHRVHEETANDPRLAAAAPIPVRPGVVSRLVGQSVRAVGVLAILLVAAGAIALPFLGSWLEHQDELERADYIVPLPGDTQRLMRAAELYRQGYAPRVLIGAGTAHAEAGQPAADTAELELRTLEKSGVPRESIELADMGGNATIAGAAAALQRHVGSRKVKAIVIATGVHAMRTRLTFENALPRARVIVTTVPDASPQPWWSSHDSAVETLAEASRAAHYWLRGRRGLPEPDVSQAGAKPLESTGAGREAPRP